MPLFRAPLAALSEADLQALIAHQVPEGRTLDYKRDAVGRSDGDKKEFLADVSSFANAGGGHLVFGMDETGGLPTALPGLAGLDADAEIRRLDELIRDGLEPTILGVELRAVPLANGAVALVIRIPKSWNPPHQVTYQKTFRFYGRGAAGKHPLDVTALRDLVLLSADVAERVRRFRIERVAQIVAGEPPVRLRDTARMILHAVPLGAFTAGARVDLTPIEQNQGLLIALTSGGGLMRHNVDGLLVTNTGDFTSTKEARVYAQLHRNGVLELTTATEGRPDRSRTVLPGVVLDEWIIHSVKRIKAVLSAVGIAPPVVVMLTLAGMKGWEMGVSTEQSWFRDIEMTPIDRDPLFLPEILLTTFDQPADIDAKRAMRESG